MFGRTTRDSAETYAVENADTVKVDPNTTNQWTNHTAPGGVTSTQNVGRIWTDKSVFDGDYSFTNDNDAGLNGKKVEKGDSDFLVSLSALSSTSNLKEMVKTSQPLDIVLVIDTSGSMSGSKMTNLKNAANSFIDATAENNRGLEQDQQTRLAIVQFASGANTRQQLSYVTDQNVQQYKNTINGFRASGATYAEEGLQRAQSVLDSGGRADVQQIVIFFTDGEPNHQNGFDDDVAIEAVNVAHDMKVSGTIIYSIGVMNGADASVTDDGGFNEYMNAVSSNYPDATADWEYESWDVGHWFGSFGTELGTRAEGDYYKAASDPDSIEEIFDEISDEVQQGVGSGSPIEENTQQGNTEPGILTFEDQLGNYMQVTSTGAGEDKIQLAYGDQIYTSTSKSTEGYTDTYHFSGEVEGNEIYGPANLSDLVVTVERSADLAVGDKVTVTLPASLLPMRHYDVDTDAGTMTVSQAYPVRLFYGVSLKADAKTALGDPTSEAYADIVASQASVDGASIDFYSNSFIKGAADGSTTASFSPNAGNKFYYYTQDTTLYTDLDCTTEANWNNARNATTLYYKDVYWVQTGNGTAARKVTDGYGTVTSGTAEWNAIVRPYQGDAYYIPTNTQRTERPHTLTDGKDTNVTGTATNVLNPSWIAGGDVTQALGNNGKLSFEMPGSLEIKKDVDWGNASDQTKQDKNTFTFVITANVPTGEGEATELLTGSYNYYVGDSGTAAGKVTFNNGSATLTVTGGTTVRIDGLPAGTTFTVTEQGVGQNGWTVTDATSQEGVENTNTTDGVVTGTIPAGSQASLTFSNTYHAREVGLNTDTTLKVQKNLEGRDWRDTDSFDFTITGFRAPSGVDPVPVPEDTVVTVDASTDAYTASFGDITFDTPGEYRYTIQENGDPEQPIAGIDYSDAIYRVTVMVGDNGTGSLVIDSVKIELMYDDGGNLANTENEGTPVEGDTMAFKNTYSASSTDADTGSAEAKLTKVLEGKTWDGDSFTFEIKPESNTAGIETANMPMPNADADGDGSNNTVTLSAPTETDGKTAIFSFGKITFDTPGTYVYKVTEVEGDNAGITYSKNVATITITVTDNHQGALVATVGIENNVFTNTYASELDYAAGGGLKIAKTFENATMREFSFMVTPKDDASAEKLDIDMAGETFTTKPGETVGDDNASHAEVAVLDAAAEAKFTQADVDDTYTYTVKETAGSDTGVTYDDTEYTVTITTEDDGQGGIKVTTTVTDGANYNESYVYDNDDATENQTAVVPFTNTYKAEGQLGGNGAVSIKATKTLTNRPMVDGEFTFNVTNANDPNDTVVAAGTNAANGTITFSAIDYSIDQMIEDVDSGLATPDVVDGKDTFTYTYEVTEDTARLDDGVSAIDAAGFKITVTVTDNGDGTLGIAVAYPDGSDGLTFRNTYGEGQTGQATLNINGTKTLKVASGDNAPNIEGKYTFTLTGSKGAPMPATTGAHNDAAGNVAFGDITFTMENVFGDTGSQDAATNAEVDGTEEAVSAQSAIRTKEFTYTVTESGSVPGVDNDAEASKTFKVTVTDNGDGSLSVVSNPAQGALFAFTNTYSVEPEESSPTGEGGIAITKNLTGRNLNEGEFTFELVDQSGATVATGKNDASGNVELGTVKFTEPGRFTYTIREAKGSLGGVDYDATEYKATAEVKDNGDGTLAVTWSFDTAAGDPASAIEFNNTYTATPTSVLLGGTKVLDGRALAEGEFTFVLNDAGGNELQTVTNNAQGGFCFDQITYDAAGTYEYTISEVKGDAEGVTYDDATIAVKVVVTDNGKGALEVTELTYDGKTELPVFTNTYVKPVESPKDDSGLMQTGDSTSTFVGVIAGLGALSVAVGLAARKRHGE